MTTAAQLQPYNFVIGTNFVPKAWQLTNMTNANPAVATTIQAHGYSTGMVVSVNVPSTYGMSLLNMFTSITVLTPTTFSCDNINTLSLLPFVTPTNPPAFTPAQVVPESGKTYNMLPPQGPF